MATNKNATVRYHTLDKCFGNTGRKFFIHDLLEACNKVLIEMNGPGSGVKRSQIYNDIRFMESEAGWSVEFQEGTKIGARRYYRYKDPSFSIRGLGVNEGEIKQISETLEILSRFKGLPHLAWIEKTKIRLEETFLVSSATEKDIVFFEENPYLRGVDSFTEIFQAILNKQSLSITYKGVRKKKEQKFDFSPWLLKEYNNRWFLFGRNPKYGGLTNLPLDRILSVKECTVPYVKNDEVDFYEYFDDIIGVSVKSGEEIQNIRLRVSPELLPYIESKPLHGSQKVLENCKDGGKVILLQLIPNYELESTIFSHMDKIEVLSPASLRKRLGERVKYLFSLYE